MMKFKLNIQLFGGAHDTEMRREMQERYQNKKSGKVENPWWRFTNKVPKWISKDKAKEIKRSSAYKTAYMNQTMSNIEAGGGGAREGGVGNDPQGWGGTRTSGQSGLSYGDIVGKLGTPDAPQGTGQMIDYAGSANIADIDVGDIMGSTVTGKSITETFERLSFSSPMMIDYAGSANIADIDVGDIMGSTVTGKSITETFERLSFSSPMMRDFAGSTASATGADIDASIAGVSERFSEQFGNIGSYEQFQESLGQYGIETMDVADLSKMTAGEAQDYLDKMAGQGVQSFEAFEKTSMVQNLSDLENMQRAMLGRITETYDPSTASFDQRMEFNSAVRSLQQVGEAPSLSEDIRAGDYAKLATGAVSALMGNPMGMASLGLNLSNLASTDYTAMGQLSKYGKFVDPSLRSVGLSSSQLDELGRMQGDIQDFSKTVRTAEENRELDRYIQTYLDTRDDMIERISVQTEGIGQLEETKAVEKPDDAQAQGGTELAQTGRRGILFNRDVSNKGLGDVISVFGQITTEEEEERRVRELGARRRLGLAGLWGV